MKNTMERKRRSEKMEPQEVRALNKYINSIGTKAEATEAIGISRPTLDIVLIRKSGAPETIEKIRAAIGEAQKVRA